LTYRALQLYRWIVGEWQESQDIMFVNLSPGKRTTIPRESVHGPFMKITAAIAIQPRHDDE
jgi:hypothetical protein